MKAKEELSELSRAEDILLGAVGFSEDAQLENLRVVQGEIFLQGSFRSDSEKFSIKYDLECGPLESWAIEILKKEGLVDGV